MSAQATDDLTIPDDLLPGDGRFGCGPSKVRGEAVDHLAGAGRMILGTSHRQKPVKGLVERDPRRARASCSALPDGYEVALGNGGTTAFWDAAAFGLVDERAVHMAYGEFSRKFAARHRRRAVPAEERDPRGRARRRARPRAGRQALDRRARRRDRLGPQRDLDRRDGAGRAPRGGRRGAAC